MRNQANKHILPGLIVLLIALLISSVSPAISPPVQLRSVDFNREIRPILSDNCFTCHGPDETRRKSSLRLDTREGAFARPDLIQPRKASQSQLVRRITSEDPNLRMPPPDSGHALSDAQIGLIIRWIDEGAVWNEHWAWLPPRQIKPPTAAITDRVHNPIDAFILDRLKQENLSPAPEADKATLLRRLTLDLTGLPPTVAELEAFLRDTSPAAWEKAVDRLLASPHYGERMAMQWLDLARYADTHGFHIDSHRDMWPWRDWVINAFRSNLPYDQFTIAQLAGDLLPQATQQQIIASGFNRNHMINFEGGAIPEEYQVEYVVDRVETTATAFMALTMGCARCHTHKYDPVTQTEFYRFFAFFNNISEQGLDGREGNARPLLELPAPDQQRQRDKLQAAIREQESILDKTSVSPAQEAWETKLTGKPAQAPQAGLLAHYELDASFADASGRQQHGHMIRGEATFGQGIVGQAVTIDEQTQITFGSVGSITRNKPFTIAFWLNPSIGNAGVRPLHRILDQHSRRGYEFLLDDISFVGIQRRASPVTFRLTADWPDDAIIIKGTQLVTSGKWSHITLSYDGSARAASLRLWINGQPDPFTILKDTLTRDIYADAELQSGDRSTGLPYTGKLDDLRIYDRPLHQTEIRQLAVDYPAQALLSGIYGKTSQEQEDQLREHFLTWAAPARLRTAHSNLKELKKQLTELQKSILSVMVMNEQSAPRDTFVLARGDYRNRTDKVSPGVPAILPPLTARNPDGSQRRLNRLDLARWLVSPDHPLTARVAVNRFWQMFFGTGLVKTSEDFGSQGEPPSHPELLDWLATEFIRSGWDVKAMLRLIATSATYRQSSRVSPALSEKDPENRLLARGPRFRLPAEIVRDNALAISGLLNPAIGGPSVFPYHPQGLWEEMAFGDGFSAQTYIQSHGGDLYRRSLYTFWKRTVPPPTLSAFDAPDREKCIARRAITNTPLQALITLNDPTYIEAARVMAQRALLSPGITDATRITSLFRQATARPPDQKEIRVLTELLRQQQARFRQNPAAATSLIRIGETVAEASLNPAELAAWTMVASAILNLDETITKE